MTSQRGIADVRAEFSGVSLGDARLDARLARIVGLIAVAAADSFGTRRLTFARAHGVDGFYCYRL